MFNLCKHNGCIAFQKGLLQKYFVLCSGLSSSNLLSLPDCKEIAAAWRCLQEMYRDLAPRDELHFRGGSNAKSLVDLPMTTRAVSQLLSVSGRCEETKVHLSKYILLVPSYNDNDIYTQKIGCYTSPCIDASIQTLTIRRPKIHAFKRYSKHPISVCQALQLERDLGTNFSPEMIDCDLYTANVEKASPTMILKRTVRAHVAQHASCCVTGGHEFVVCVPPPLRCLVTCHKFGVWVGWAWCCACARVFSDLRER